ncbi:MAG: rane protein [Acidimicrobiales bacterium]|nr:rane protein [Acidimicrobiales bacterium]
MRALRAFTIVVLGLGLIAAACGGGGGSSETPAQAKAKITANWEKFFDPKVPLASKANIVENYDTLKPILETQTTSPQAQQIKAKVTDVTLSGSSSAKVTYDIISTQNNTPLLPGAAGEAIKQGSDWKVTVKTFCSLIKLADQNAKCP